ncbi:Agamous-like MADS-box protein AGL62 [Camellia lanceoleosa]|uniref:Agamous-like MADS-box protein AGL62 n=1 Tax=Camellia lanceoleosa TaxID=1840588 RepID=A0ACC0IMV8_9ERIC|nr:Agamous-like MADS-box protein AGL62 [Camellia lanceoleosa]
MAKKPSMGRQKIKIEKIEIKNHLQVTFSKRRSGLFKKASELCTLCGIEIAIIVFSPAGKVFSFGHPNVDSIVDQFLTRNPPPNTTTRHLIEAHRSASVRELNLQLTQVLNELEVEKRHGETLDHTRKASQRQYWWEAPIDKLGLHELEQLRNSMVELKKNVTNQANKIQFEGTTNPSPFFLANGTRMVDHFESKTSHINASSSITPNVHNFGYYGHGFF